jgi:hypothetical protein
MSKLTIRAERVESNLYKPSSRALSKPSRVYTNMSHLIYEQIIVFTNDLFIFRTKTKSSLSKLSRTEFMSSRAHLTPQFVLNFVTCSLADAYLFGYN